MQADITEGCYMFNKGMPIMPIFAGECWWKAIPHWNYCLSVANKKTEIKNKQGRWVEKNVFALYPEEMTLEMAIESLKTSLPNLCKHIYTANYQWHACSTLQNHLNKSSVITVEDYQINIEVEFTENPTSLAYSTNKLLYALYLICVEYLEGGIVKKSAVSFISSDKKHIINKFRNLNSVYSK